MSTAIIVLLVLAAGAAAFWHFRNKSTSTLPAASSTPASGGAAAAVQEKEELARLYHIGLHPAEDGMPVMYALETCRHCRRTKEFLDEHHIRYHLIYVDQYTGDERAALMDKIRSYNPRGSFPTVILPEEKVIVGYREQLLREALLNDTPSTT